MKFEIAYPVAPNYLNQAFGVNGAYYKSHGINIIGHNGLDLNAKHGQPVYAAHDGIAYYEVDDQQGAGFVIRTTEEYDFVHPQNPSGKAYFKTIYWHLCPAGSNHPKYDKPHAPVISTTIPTLVKCGELIGYADSTGLSTGDHLHFGLKPIRVSITANPEDSTDLGIGAFANVLQLNGYGGAVDPTPYFNGRYATDNDKEVAVSKIVALAAQKQTEGNTKLSNILFAIAELVKSFWR